MNDRSKLFSHASEDFQIYRNTDETGYVVTVRKPRMPLPSWPNGHWCFEVAYYLNTGSTPLSIADKGGSYSTITYALSHLVRYCSKNRIGFLEMSDSRFTSFIDGLAVQDALPDGSRKKIRSNSQIITIGRRALAFLYTISEFYYVDNFVANTGTIRGFQKAHLVPSHRRGGEDIIKYYWHHASFPHPSPKTRRHPISDEYISKLRRAVVVLSVKPFLRQRRFAMLRLFEATGARRIELANLTVASVLEAKANQREGEKPFLRLWTFKKRHGPLQRLVPIDQVDLNALLDYIEIYRAPVVAKFGQDCGFFLISLRGKKLESNTLTLEMYLLRQAAGIEGKAHCHLFRHRFICKKLASLIRESEFQTRNAVVSWLLRSGAELTKLLEYTGQSSITALEPYIDDAFMKEAGPKVIVNGHDLSGLASSAQATLEELALLQGAVPDEELQRLTMNSFQVFVAALQCPANIVS